MKKQYLHYFMRVCLFGLLVVSLIFSLGLLFKPKDITKKAGLKNATTLGFYTERPNSLDVVGIGNSGLYNGINPLWMYEEKGITSYMVSDPLQKIAKSYLYFQEVLKTQKPKVVFLDADELITKGSYSDGVRAFGINLNHFFPFFEYHSRWKELKAEDFTLQTNYHTRVLSKGYRFTDVVVPFTGKYMVKTDKKESMSAITLLYLNKFRDLCDKNDIEFFITCVPNAKSWNYAKHNTIVEYCEKENIPLLDMNTCIDDFDLNWKTDTRDQGDHLNDKGAKKVTSYLANYITKNYQLEDHRNDKDYDSWNIDLAKFKKKYESK